MFKLATVPEGRVTCRNLLMAAAGLPTEARGCAAFAAGRGRAAPVEPRAARLPLPASTGGRTLRVELRAARAPSLVGAGCGGASARRAPRTGSVGARGRWARTGSASASSPATIRARTARSNLSVPHTIVHGHLGSMSGAVGSRLSSRFDHRGMQRAQMRLLQPVQPLVTWEIVLPLSGLRSPWAPPKLFRRSSTTSATPRQLKHRPLLNACASQTCAVG